MFNPRSIILKPVLTEKATNLREGNKYAFRVHPKANKIAIRQAVEEIFSVKVESVRTVSVPRRPKRQYVSRVSSRMEKSLCHFRCRRFY